MVKEILLIKPKLSGADAKQMEATLSSRFGKVARRFKVGLKAAITGTAFGIGIGLLAKLLNPLQEMEEKIKALLGQSAEIGDQADRLGTSPAKLKRAQDVASSYGIKPEELNEVLNKFAETVETARKEFRNVYEERSEASKTIGEDLANQKDILQSFFTIQKRLQDERQVTGRKEEGGTLTGAENAAEIERLVFGAQQFGRIAKFLSTDLETRAKYLGLPSEKATAKSLRSLDRSNSQFNELTAADEAKDFNRTADASNLAIVNKIVKLDQRERDAFTKRIETSFDDLATAKDGLITIKNFVEQIQVPILRGLGELPLLIEDLKSLPGILRRWRPW